MDNKYVYEPGVTNDLLDSEGNIKDLSILDLTPSSLLSPPKITELGSGNLSSGIVHMYTNYLMLEDLTLLCLLVVV